MDNSHLLKAFSFCLSLTIMKRREKANLPYIQRYYLSNITVVSVVQATYQDNKIISL